jgi:hypothetical protein
MSAFKQKNRGTGYLAVCDGSRSMGNQSVDFVDAVLVVLAVVAGLSVDAVLFESEAGAVFCDEESDFEAVASAVAGFAAPFSPLPLLALDDSAGGLLFFA